MDELIEQIYQAAYSPELWTNIMQNLAQVLDAASATMLYRESSCPEGPAVDAQFGATPAEMQSYANYFRMIDFRFQDVQKLAPGEVLVDDHNFDFEAFKGTEIYQEFWKPARRGRGMAGLLFKGTTRTSVVSARRYLGGPPFSDFEVHTFRQLLPHLRRSLQFRGHLVQANIRADALRIALDQFPIAVFLIDRHCTVLDHNQAARELLADLHSALEIRDQRLAAVRPAESRELHEAVRAAASSLHQLDAQPSYLHFNMRDDIRTVGLMPVPISESFLNTPSELVLLFCHETSWSHVDPMKLQRRFGFTPAESRLVAAISEGATLEEFARKRRISIGTARFQLKSAMAKADVHTQAQLVGTVLRSLAVLVRGR